MTDAKSAPKATPEQAAALERLEPGDLCLILVDQVEEALAHLSQRISQGGLSS